MDIKSALNNLSGSEKQSRGLLISEIVLLLYGIFLLVLPTKALNFSVAFVGIIFIAAGAFCGFWFFYKFKEANYPVIAAAVIGILVGVLTIVFRDAIALILFPVLLGIWCLITALFGGYAAFNQYKNNNGLWWIPLLAGVVALFIAILVFLNLSGTERFMARILGLYFITYNFIRLAEYFIVYTSFLPAINTNSTKSNKKAHKKTIESRNRKNPRVNNSYEQDYYDYKEYDDKEFNTDSYYDERDY